MSSDDSDRYNILVMRSQLKKSIPEDTYETINNERLIPLDELRAFYTDSLFYLHFFNTLYLEVYLLDMTLGYDIEELNKVLNNMQIVINTVTDVTPNNEMRMGVLEQGNPSASPVRLPTFTFYTKMFEKYYHNIDAYAYYNTRVSQITRDSSVYIAFPFTISLPKNDINAQSGTEAKATIKIKLSTGEFYAYSGTFNTPSAIYFEINGGGGDKYFSSSSAGGDYTFYNSEMSPPLVDLTRGSGIFKNGFLDSIGDLRFTVNKGKITKIEPMTTLRGTIPQIKLTPNVGNDIDIYKPQIKHILMLPSSFGYDTTNIIDTTVAFGNSSGVITYSILTGESKYNLNEFISKGVNLYQMGNGPVRKKRFRNTMWEILSTKTQNIYGFLVYQKIYYNCIVCNTSIQLLMRELYINNPNLNLELDGQSPTITTITTNLTQYVGRMSGNLQALRGITSVAAKDFVNDKDFYIDRITLLNDVKNNFNETLEVLNSVTFDYNQYLSYYSKIKGYTSAIIVFLVILIVSSIVVTVLPTFDYNAKNSYYLFILVLLVITTVLYYYNFRHIGLYEKFDAADRETNVSLLSSTGSPFGYSQNQLMRIDANLFEQITGKGKNTTNLNTVTRLDENARIMRNNNYHREFSNGFFGTELFNYNGAYLVLSTEVSTSIHVTNNKTFSKGTNDYLYKLYVEKSRLNEMNKLRKTKYGSVIEAIKKQITFMYNLILIICFVSMILVTCLLLYNLGSISIEFIIIFAVVSLLLVMFVFIFALIQPTRMKANKNYWSNTNPSEVTLGQL
jgi:membrane protease YdiL (CAAX protease family)